MAKRTREPWKPGDEKARKPRAPKPEKSGTVTLGLTVTPEFRRDMHILAIHSGKSISELVMEAMRPQIQGIHIRFGRGSAGGGEQTPEPVAEAEDALKIAG